MMTRMFQKHFIQINYLTKAITRFGPDGYHLVGRERTCLVSCYLEYQLRMLIYPVTVGIIKQTIIILTVHSL